MPRPISLVVARRSLHRVTRQPIHDDDSTSTIELIGVDATASARIGDGRLLIERRRAHRTDRVEGRGRRVCVAATCAFRSAAVTELVVGDEVDLIGIAELLGLPLVDRRSRGARRDRRRRRPARGRAQPRARRPSSSCRTSPATPCRSSTSQAASRCCSPSRAGAGAATTSRPGSKLHDELAPHGFGIVAVAIDEAAEDVTPWVEEVSFPVLLDADRSFSDRYGVVNVPTVIWVDEDRQIVEPNAQAFGNDEFIEFHGIDSTGHHEALRRWVLDGVRARRRVRRPRPTTSPDGSARPEPSSASRSSCGAAAASTPRCGISSTPASSHLMTSRSGAPGSCCRVATRSASSSSPSTRRGRSAPAAVRTRATTRSSPPRSRHPEQTVCHISGSE